LSVFRRNIETSRQGKKEKTTYLAGRLVLVKAIVSLLDSSSLWLPLHIVLDTDDSVDLGLYGEITRLGELSRAGSRSGRLHVS
jgi:hypothetical protein